MIKNLFQKIRSMFQPKSYQTKTISDGTSILNKGDCTEVQTNLAIQTDSSPSCVCGAEEESFQKMDKGRALALFRQNGHVLSRTTTFASKNKTIAVYWANPNFNVLNEQWNLILHDRIRRELHLFVIPAHAISAQSLVCRADKIHQIDLQIMYDDPSFTDTRSKMSFAKFLTQSIKY